MMKRIVCFTLAMIYTAMNIGVAIAGIIASIATTGV